MKIKCGDVLMWCRCYGRHFNFEICKILRKTKKNIKRFEDLHQCTQTCDYLFEKLVTSLDCYGVYNRDKDDFGEFVPSPKLINILYGIK